MGGIWGIYVYGVIGVCMGYKWGLYRVYMGLYIWYIEGVCIYIYMGYIWVCVWTI